MFLVLGKHKVESGSTKEVLDAIKEGRVPLPPIIKIVGLYSEHSFQDKYDCAAIIQAPDDKTARELVIKLFSDVGIDAQMFLCSKFE